jgi:thioredoxin-like negative regulator of GroEL
MNTRKNTKHPLPSLLLAGLLSQPVLALAFGEPYMQARFDALNQGGKPVLVHIHAPWCPTCRAQDKRLGRLFQVPGNKAIAALEVSFDNQKDVVRAFRASGQSVLIGFKDGREVGRLVGETREDRIADFLARLR